MCAAIAGLQDFRGEGPPGDIGVFQAAASAIVYQFTFSGVTYIVAQRMGVRGWILVCPPNIDANTVIQAAITALPLGGRIILRSGSYTVTAQINLLEGICIEGEWSGDDAAAYGVSLVRTTDNYVFWLTGAGHNIAVKNIVFRSNPTTPTTFYIGCNGAKRNLIFDHLTFTVAASGGIDLDGSYFVTCSNIRGLQLGDYVIKNNIGHSLNIFEMITAVGCNGIFNLYYGQADIIRGVGSDTFTGLTQTLIAIERGTTSVTGIEFEGDAINGSPVYGLTCLDGIITISDSYFRNMGNPGNTRWPMSFTGTTRVTLDGIYFLNTLSGRDFVRDANTTHLTRHNIIESAGNNFYDDNRVPATIAAVATSVVVAHGCAYTPVAGDIHPTLINLPTTPIGDIYIDTIGAANFTLHCTTPPGAATAIFDVSIQRTP